MKHPLFLVLTIPAFLASCQGPQLELKSAEAANPAQASEHPMYEWSGDTVPGQMAVNISLGEQKAHFFRGGKPVGWSYVAAGVPGHPTPRGNFAVMEKQEKKHSNRYGMIVNSAGDIVDGDAAAGRESIPSGGRFVGAPMPYWMRLTSYGIGMHAGPIPDPGFPASHGCIRFPPAMAEKLFSVVEVGTPVTIQ